MSVCFFISGDFHHVEQDFDIVVHCICHNGIHFCNLPIVCILIIMGSHLCIYKVHLTSQYLPGKSNSNLCTIKGGRDVSNAHLTHKGQGLISNMEQELQAWFFYLYLGI